MSQSFSSVGSLSGSDSPRSTAVNEAQSNRLQLLLKKHLSVDGLQASRVEQYHQREFIGRIDSIVQKWMVKAIFELKHEAEKKLTIEAENAMISAIRVDLDRHFPMPTSDEQIDKLKATYLNFVGNQSSNLPQYYNKAYYLTTGMVPENGTVARIHTTLRPKFLEALDQLWRLSYAVHLLVPNLADSHNTGVVVQKKISKCIRGMKNAITDFLVSYGWLTYAKTRCFYLKHISTTPQSVDARLAYLNFERSNFRYMRSTVMDLAQELLMLQHLIMQHIEFVKKPRQDHTSNLAAKILN